MHVVVLFESYEGDKEQKKMVAMAVGGRMGSAAAAAPVSATPNEHINASVQRQPTLVFHTFKWVSSTFPIFDSYEVTNSIYVPVKIGRVSVAARQFLFSS